MLTISSVIDIYARYARSLTIFARVISMIERVMLCFLTVLVDVTLNCNALQQYLIEHCLYH
jgi:hypothetical protein